MKKIIVFNWKMAPQSLGEARRLLNASLNLKSEILNQFEIVVCPPFIYLSEIAGLIDKTKIKLGAQDLFYEDQGPYTGEVSAKILKNLGVEYVIIGHSERRKFLGETDEMIDKKVLTGLKAGLKVVLCIGENLSIRRRGKKAVENFIRNQLQKDLKGIYDLKPKTQNLIIAYEPIWAIGTGHSDTPEDAIEMIKYIKQTLKAKSYKLKAKVLYGGSVDGKNIKNFIQLKEIDGVLVGGASVKKDEVRNIIRVLNYER